MASRFDDSARPLPPRVGKRPEFVPLRAKLPRYAPIRQLLAINDLCAGLDITYDTAVRHALGYETELLDADEADAVLDWLRVHDGKLQ